jgi:hypothetical protein
MFMVCLVCLSQVLSLKPWLERDYSVLVSPGLTPAPDLRDARRPIIR